MAPKVLVTGGAGFIGSHLSELLLDDGAEVWVLDDLSTGSLDNVAHLRDRAEFHLVIDTMLSRTVVNELVNKVDLVYHLAAAVGPRLIVEQPVHTIVTNLEGSEIVLDHCARFGRRVLVASTSEVYGDHRSPEPLREDARRIYGPTTQKRWLYADSKAMDEYLALAYRQERDLDFVVPRLFNTVGPRQSGQYGMVVARFVQAAVSGRPLEIHGDGTQTRTFCHVNDTIRALKGLMDSTETTGEIYNVGSRNWISVEELARRVLELAGVGVRARASALRQGLRHGHRRHAPSGARDREDRGRHRLDADTLARRHPPRRDRVRTRLARGRVVCRLTARARARRPARAAAG